ncbi:MAG: glycine--tRNA ligase subunit beta [Rhodospirillaceae bacterium]|nr:MAG: glycine--tRNA ligase subunit beta [Rhodospirillaceae bacterium]
MAELLLELLSEEIPARMQAKAGEDIVRLVGDALKAQGLPAASIAAFVGPRRVALVADGIPAAQPDVNEERKGPAVGAPEAAISGFLRASGLSSLDQAEVRELPKGKFYFAVIKKAGRPTAVVLKEIIEAALAQLPWPKSMRWASNPARWVRPLHRMVCVFDGAVVKVAFAGVTAGDITVGHRFLAPAEIKVTCFADYTAKLKQAFVMIDPAERSKTISENLARLAAAENLKVTDDPGLLAEVTGLVEWPVPLMGTIDARFMDVPAEVLTSAMRKHQKYFALADASGKFSPRFGVIANMVNADGGKVVVAGNERVLRARLSDAKFFWDKDRQEKLESRLPKLDERVFQAKLGTVHAKVERIARLAAALAKHVPGADNKSVTRAAYLCKCDLSTDMVGEFPDLQGLMGRYYALHDHEEPTVANAIADHYSPLGPNDACPTAPVSIAVALADKIDTLAGFFGIDEKPTGSKDPYALRRAALGVIRLILENKLRLPLRQVFAEAVRGYGAVLAADPEKMAGDLLDFFADRLKVHLRDKGIRHDLIAAVFALGDEDDLVRLIARVEALAAFLSSDDGANLLIAYRRAVNIVRIEEKKDATTYSGAPASADLGASEATALLTQLEEIESAVTQRLSKDDFGGAMGMLAKLRRPVDTLFDKVTINAEVAAHRVARLKLLARIGFAMGQVADFSLIEG